MKRTLKYLLRREAYNRTKRAFRELEKAGENKREAKTDESEPRVTVETRVSGETMNPDTDLERVLQSMDDYDFEHFVADLWERMGWTTDVSTQSADRGIDVIATRRSPYEETALIQAKRYGPNTTVGSPAIQQYASLKHQRHGVDKVVVVTTNGFSGQAEELAHQLNVKLVDGHDLVGLIEDLDALDLLERYVPAIREPEPESDVGAVEPTERVSPEIPSGQRTGAAVAAETVDAERKEEGPLARRLPGERWQWVAATTALWPVAVVLGGADGGISLLIAWIGLPYAILKDGTWTRFRRWYAAAAALLPVFAMFVGSWYLVMRWRAVGFDAAERDYESNEPAIERPREKRRSETDDGYSATYDHYTEAVEDVKRLNREGRHDEAESLLWWCIESAERQAREQGYDTVPPWYYEHLAIVYRKDGRYADEVAVLERYVERGGEKEELLDRLERARELAR